MAGKLEYQGEDTTVDPAQATDLLAGIMQAAGCDEPTALAVAEHLTDASLCGVASHGLVRAMQYVQQFETRYMDPAGRPVLQQNEFGAWEVHGNGGIGIPAMHMGLDHCMIEARERGIAAIAVKHCGHTGRLGAYAEKGADHGFLTICVGGGGRQNWRQVAPYGGARGLLPTNPYAFGIPGGDDGPVMIDFATGSIAAGWIYAARSADALLPEGTLVDAQGRPTRNPKDYFDGGAILPFGGPKGYGLGLMAEMIGEAMLGPSTTECNWFIICVDTGRWREPPALQAAAEEILSEVRACPPAQGFERVEVPGERERRQRAENLERGITLPLATWQQIEALAARLGVGNS